MNEEEFQFAINAIKFVADNGYIFLPLYKYYIDTGEWKHITYNNKSPYRKWLNNIKLEGDKLVGDWTNPTVEVKPELYNNYIKQANDLIKPTKDSIISNRCIIN